MFELSLHKKKRPGPPRTLSGPNRMERTAEVMREVEQTIKYTGSILRCGKTNHDPGRVLYGLLQRQLYSLTHDRNPLGGAASTGYILFPISIPR